MTIDVLVPVAVKAVVTLAIAARAYEQSRRQLAGKSTPDLLTIATGSTTLPERALAL